MSLSSYSLQQNSTKMDRANSKKASNNTIWKHLTPQDSLFQVMKNQSTDHVVRCYKKKNHQQQSHVIIAYVVGRINRCMNTYVANN